MDKKKHGGARPGAGRKPKGAVAKETTSISIDPDVLDEARRAAIAKGVSLSQFIEDVVREARRAALGALKEEGE